MRRLALLCAAVAALAVTFGIAPAGAAPDNKNTGSLDVVCDPPIGSTQVTFIAQSNGEAAFFANGMFGVIKATSFTGTVTFSIEGGPTFQFPDEFGKGGNGQGYQGRLIECTAQVSDEQQFTLTSDAAAELGAELGIDLTPYIGSTVHVSDSGTFTAQVILPGA
jgi:hypothetical protein